MKELTNKQCDEIYNEIILEMTKRGITVIPTGQTIIVQKSKQKILAEITNKVITKYRRLNQC